ncbi:MAG: DUF3810 domain-containing protein [Lachnospiraceae bacterium]|nr:DUF3810 domain-containing protein [Lachnospiraceae bacterium]
MKKAARRKKISKIIYVIGMLGVIMLNYLAWRSREFCDWYIDHIFPVWLNTYARLTSALSISVGEIMLILAVGITAFGIGFFIYNLIRRGKYTTGLLKYGRTYAWIVLAVGYVMTLNCFILYHATGFAQKYMVKETGTMVVDMSDTAVVEVDTKGKSAYTKKNLATLRDYLVEQCNTLADQIDRDEQGTAVYSGDLIAESVHAMETMGQQYDRLSGYYVTPKYLKCSEFFSQQYIMGYYFPFSMEANINSVMYITNVAPTVCHELAHTKGFIFENDANMIGYLACIQSDDTFLQYCGYLSVLNYVNNDFYKSVNKSTYKKHVRISDRVADDNVFLTREDWQAVEKTAVVKTSTVKKVSNNFLNTNLKLNGVDEGIQQYNEVVNLLLDYYDGILY